MRFLKKFQNTQERQAYLADGNHMFYFPGKCSFRKYGDYVYYAEYEDLDYDYALEKIWDRFPQPSACSSVRSGNWYGRNLDFYFNTTVEMVIKTPAKDGRNAVLGSMGCMDEIYKGFCETREFGSIYKLVPFQITDGINDKGVIANINVVPAGDKGFTTGSTPAVQTREIICGAMLVRYILDNFDTAEEAVEYIRDYVSVYAPSTDYLHFEYHYMVADPNHTYVLEFINNQANIINVDDNPWMTNFYLTGVEFDNHFNVSYTGSNLTPYSSGVERYNLIANTFRPEGSYEWMEDLMRNQLRYTKAYEFGTYEPFWYTEFAGDELTMEVIGNPDYRSAINEVVSYYSTQEFKNSNWTGTNIPRTVRADGVHGTWETSHTSIYDIENRRLHFWAKEGDQEYVFDLGVRNDTEPPVEPPAPGGSTYFITNNRTDDVMIGRENEMTAVGQGQMQIIMGWDFDDTLIYSENDVDLYDGEGNFVYRYAGGTARHLSEYPAFKVYHSYDQMTLR